MIVGLTGLTLIPILRQLAANIVCLPFVAMHKKLCAAPGRVLRKQ